LTFDVCQDPAYPAGFDLQIVQTLTQANTPATFFMGGDWMRTHPQETALLGSYPFFELGNHSWSHPDLRTLDDGGLRLEILQTQDMLYRLTGRQAHLFRLPFGYGDERVLNMIAAYGLYTIQWDVETGDPDPNFSAEIIQRGVRERVQNGSIIIMHANGRGWHTAEALPRILDELRSRGFTLVTVSQLLGLAHIPQP
jgi:peptidoglycan/xylan/chitin deacetylase (PgdA/CDA1 family)